LGPVREARNETIVSDWLNDLLNNPNSIPSLVDFYRPARNPRNDEVRSNRFWRTIVNGIDKIDANSNCIPSSAVGDLNANPKDTVARNRNWHILSQLMDSTNFQNCVEGGKDPCDCEQDPAVPCDHCESSPNCTPENIAFTVSGISLCTCVNDGSSSRKMGTLTLAGPYTLVQTAACNWGLDPIGGESSIVYEQYNNTTTCDDATSPTTETDSMLARLLRNGTEWQFNIHVNIINSPVIFSVNIPESSDENCRTITASSNSKSSTDCSYISWAYGGEVSFEMCP
jgi:hypothetical protein